MFRLAEIKILCLSSIIIIIIVVFFVHQNVRITEVLTAVTERLRTVLAAIIVTVESDLVGFVSRAQPEQECQLHVHLHTDVTLMQPAG